MIEVLSLDHYQQLAEETAIYPASSKLVYPVLGLNGEAGEVAEKVKKIIRDTPDQLEIGLSDETKAALVKELGDVLWYVALTARDLGVRLSYVASTNIDKLHSRKDRNKLHGSGDDR